MTTRPYSECLAQALALCGVPDANTAEVARVKIFLNRRAKQAYAESELWPRWLVVGEERIVSEDGLLPYSQDGLRDIGTIQRIHESQPFVDDPAGEYVDWTSQADGVQITRYQPSRHSTLLGDLVIGEGSSPDLTGYTYIEAEENQGKPIFRQEGYNITDGVGHAFWWDGDEWYLAEGAIPYWYSTDDVASPADVSTWNAANGATGTFTVSEDTIYSAFITYKAAFSVTYGMGDDEEDEVPEEWFEWMATGAAASFLFSDKEPEPAIILESQARADLDQQLDKISRQNGNKVQTRILSHGNMQARN